MHVVKLNLFTSLIYPQTYFWDWSCPFLGRRNGSWSATAIRWFRKSFNQLEDWLIYHISISINQPTNQPFRCGKYDLFWLWVAVMINEYWTVDILIVSSNNNLWRHNSLPVTARLIYIQISIIYSNLLVLCSYAF